MDRIVFFVLSAASTRQIRFRITANSLYQIAFFQANKLVKSYNSDFATAMTSSARRSIWERKVAILAEDRKLDSILIRICEQSAKLMFT